MLSSYVCASNTGKIKKDVQCLNQNLTKELQFRALE
jgi:hypothetical protein